MRWESTMRQVRGWLIFPVICLVVAACSSSNHRAATTSTPPVAEAALDGLLLSPAEINAAVSATGMTVTDTSAKIDDHSADVSNKDCLATYGPGEPSVYAGSGASATRALLLKDGADGSQTRPDMPSFRLSYRVHQRTRRPPSSPRPRNAGQRAPTSDTRLPTSGCGTWVRSPTPTAH